MSVQLFKTLSALSIFIMLTACASNAAVRLEPGQPLPAAVSAAAAQHMPLKRYEHLIMDPVDISIANPDDWKDVSEKQLAAAVQLVYERFAQATLAAEAIKPATAKNATLKLNLTLEGISLSSPTMAAISHILPIGLIVNAGKSVTGSDTPRNMGSVTISGELRDADSGALVAKFRTQQGPDAMNLGAVFSQDSAMTAAIEKAADNFKTALIKARKGEPVCRAESASLTTC